MPAATMKQIHVGVFELNGINIDLYAVSRTQYDGGRFYFTPDGTSKPRMKVWIDSRWEVVYETLLHEAMEMVMVMQGFRYQPCDKVINDPANHLFLFNHLQFTNVIALVGLFAVQAGPALHKEWDKERKKRRRVRYKRGSSDAP